MKVSKGRLSFRDAGNIFEREKCLASEIVTGNDVMIIDGKQEHCLILHKLIIEGRTAENQKMTLFILWLFTQKKSMFRMHTINPAGLMTQIKMVSWIIFSKVISWRSDVRFWRRYSEFFACWGKEVEILLYNFSKSSCIFYFCPILLQNRLKMALSQQFGC